MLKEMNKDEYAKDDKAVDDINLENRDQEIQFGETEKEEQKDDSKNQEKDSDLQTIEKNEIVDI